MLCTVCLKICHPFFGILLANVQVDLYTTVAKKEIGSAQTRLQLDVECEDADGTEFSCAPVYVGIR